MECGCSVRYMIGAKENIDAIMYCPLHRAAPQLREALEKAIDLIVNEYCSHPNPCSEHLKTCYASEQLAALTTSQVPQPT